MREIQGMELSLVAGGGEGQCSPADGSGNSYGGVTDTTTVGGELINFYEGLVSAVSHVIERVAEAL